MHHFDAEAGVNPISKKKFCRLSIYNYLLDSALVSTSFGGLAAAYGYWMHMAPDGRSGYLQPGYLAAC